MNTFEIEKFVIDCEDITKKIEALKSNNNLVIDGVIEPKRYFNAKPRILWILKEANSSESWSLIEKFKNPVWLSQCNGLSSIRRVIYTSYGILYGENKAWKEFPWSNEEECLNALLDIAYINIKKVPGGNSSLNEEIANAYETNRHILKMQFDIYNPDIIIFGNTMQYVNLEDFQGLNNAEKMISDFNNHYFYGDNKLYINAWHPACRGKGFTDSGYVMDIVEIYRNWENINKQNMTEQHQNGYN